MLKPEINLYGEKSVLLNWPSEINDAIHHTVLKYQNYIEEQFSECIQETNIGYQSLLVIFKTNKEAISKLKVFGSIDISESQVEKKTHYIFDIPVCYHPELGADLENLAFEKKMSIEELITLHTDRQYKIYFTGFLPGFLYLGGLDSKLHTPRKSKPGLVVPKGSVAIGGEQTGIYPQRSPGGWHVIGRTPIDLFNPAGVLPSIYNAGDRIRFYNISLKHFEAVKKAVLLGQYTVRKEVIND